MLYLIHEEQRKKIMNAYYAQVWWSFSSMLLIVFIIAGILAIPTLVLLKTEVQASTNKINTLENDIAREKSKNSEEDAKAISNKIMILGSSGGADIRQKYISLEKIVNSVSGVTITSVTIDTLSKTIQLVTKVQDKEVAKDLVDVLNGSVFKGAEIPFSVLSQKSSFIFSQNLSYE